MSSTYWCYRCNQFVRVSSQNSIISCPNCNAGFVEEIETPTTASTLSYPAAAMYMMRNPDTDPPSGSGSGSSPRPRRNNRRVISERSPFNPVIVLRGPNDAGGGGERSGSGFELYHDDGSGSGLRPLPTSMTEFLLGSGFERLLNQLAQIEANGIGRIDRNPPASKAAVDSLPTVEIRDEHLAVEAYCAVCKEALDLGCEAREMPCKHLYHQDCILPWLSLRNSCPVCRHELPIDNVSLSGGREGTEANRGGNVLRNDDEAVGLTIWRLPGGGFAVGRFSGGRNRGRGEREFPVVYTEMDGAFNHNGAPRRTPLGSRGNVSRERGGFRRVLHNLFACFGRGESTASSSSLNSRMSRRSGTSRRQRGWGFEVNNVNNLRW